jgi:hypothetical protein
MPRWTIGWLGSVSLFEAICITPGVSSDRRSHKDVTGGRAHVVRPSLISSMPRGWRRSDSACRLLTTSRQLLDCQLIPPFHQNPCRWSASIGCLEKAIDVFQWRASAWKVKKMTGSLRDKPGSGQAPEARPYPIVVDLANRRSDADRCAAALDDF